jgi:hypothetical protein
MFMMIFFGQMAIIFHLKRNINMKKISNILSSLGGANNIEAIRRCSLKTQTQYKNLGLALLLSVFMAFIGGADIAHQFSNSRYIMGLVGFLWALTTLSFDYFLLHSQKTYGFFKILRVFVGLANISITITALFILLNQSTIDSEIRIENANAIKVIDDVYAGEKETRYAPVLAKKASAEKYRTDVVEPEKRNGYPGPKYQQKLDAYNLEIDEVKTEEARLDSLEMPYYTSFQTEREALLAKQSNNFMIKVKKLPEVMLSGGWLSLFISVCLFIFLTYIELQAIMMKFSLKETSEYDNMVKQLEDQQAKERQDKEDYLKKVAIDAEMDARQKQAEAQRKLQFTQLQEEFVEAVCREIEFEGMLDVLKTNGYGNIVQKWSDAAKHLYKSDSSLSESDLVLNDILQLSDGMLSVLDELKAQAHNEYEVVEEVFDWLVTNIATYPSESIIPRTKARDVFEDGRATTSEMAMLYMAFLRAVRVSADFVTINKSTEGERETSRACVFVTFSSTGASILSDPSEKKFVIENEPYKVFTDEQLVKEITRNQ